MPDLCCRPDTVPAYCCGGYSTTATPYGKAYLMAEPPVTMDVPPLRGSANPSLAWRGSDWFVPSLTRSRITLYCGIDLSLSCGVLYTGSGNTGIGHIGSGRCMRLGERLGPEFTRPRRGVCVRSVCGYWCGGDWY